MVGIAGILDENTSESINQLAGLRDEHEKRLRQLLRQQAHYGRSTPAEINIEIEEIQVKVGRITGDMAHLQIGSSKLIELAANVGETANLGDISNQLGNSTTTVLHNMDMIIALMLQSRDADAPQREQRQRITIVFYVVISLLVAADVLARIFLR